MSSKLLSQEEIDALLAQDTGKPTAKQEKKPEKEYRLYDFRRPDRVSKDQQRVLRNIHESFAKLLSTYLSNTLRTMIDVKSPIIDQVTYLEYTMSSSDFTNLYIFEIDRLDGQAILEIDPNFTFYIIDRLFGGTGTIISRGNQITLIEESVMMNIAKNILKNFHDAWINLEDLRPEITDFEINPQLVTIAPSSETMIILNFPIIARNYDFYIYLCFPYFMLEPVLKKLISQNYMAMLKKKITDEDREQLQQNIFSSFVDFSVELGSTNISIREFLDLNAGDIVMLDKTMHDLAVAKVAGDTRFKGVAGKSGKRLAFRVENFLDSEGEIVDE